MDHVKAHPVIKSKGNAHYIEPKWEINRNNINLTNKIMQLENVRPLPSEKFRVKGGGVHHDYFVKLDFEIAVDQQTRAHDRTFEGVSDSG